MRKRGTPREVRAQKERENVASTEFHRHGERSVHSLSDQRLKAYFEWDECLYVSLARLPRHPFALSFQVLRCPFLGGCPFSAATVVYLSLFLLSLPLFSLWALWFVIYSTRENFMGIKWSHDHAVFPDFHDYDNILIYFFFCKSNTYNYYWNFLISMFSSWNPLVNSCK